MDTTPTVTAIHNRSGDAAKETRGTIVKLTTGALGLLIFVATRNVDPVLSLSEKIALIVSILFVVVSLAFAIWFGFGDAQWAYWWGVELDPTRTKAERDNGKANRLKWHGRKSFAEKAMLVSFVLAGVSMGTFVLLRVLNLGD